MDNYRQRLKDAKRIVIKVGTSTLTYDTGKINFSRMDRLARSISDLMNQGREMVLVTSGAIGAGMGRLNMDKRPQTIREKQAVAAVGQIELMHLYNKYFSEYNHIAAQILLTQDVIVDPAGRENVMNTFDTLLDKGIIPVVNENDSVSVAEIKAGEFDTFSENDTLSAIVSKLIRADLLVILSDIEGLYDCDPRKNDCSKLILSVDQINETIEKYAGGNGTERGTGGMRTKIDAAKIATASGVDVVLANGDNPDILIDIINGLEKGTLFKAVSFK